MITIFALFLLLTPQDLTNPVFQSLDTFESMQDCDKALEMMVTSKEVPIQIKENLKCVKVEFKAPERKVDCSKVRCLET